MKCRRIFNFPECTIDYIVSIVSEIGSILLHPSFCFTSQQLQFFKSSLPAEMNHFHRQWKTAEGFNPFGFISHYYQMFTIRSYDFFPEQGTPASFNKL